MSEPLDLEDDRPSVPRPQRRPQPQPSAAAIAGEAYGTAKWVFVGAGVVLILIGFVEKSYMAIAALAGVACFFGILARMMQAEQHRRPLRGILLASLFALGAAMTATAQDPKKAELPPLKAPFNERVKFEQIDPSTGRVEWFADDVDALFQNDKWHVRSGAKYVKIKPLVGSRVTNSKGEVWAVDGVQLIATATPAKYILTVTTRAKAEKKP